MKIAKMKKEKELQKKRLFIRSKHIDYHIFYRDAIFMGIKYFLLKLLKIRIERIDTKIFFSLF